ncbi:zinc-ribbon domain-containing protein [Gymnodinialimonas sp. 57CJ19]|uniref:zinc-ribbon domain-containing protein n=1 Tax=Gymnodinialimonas sp. 57CJ19 TaxID=3138498 RepID=UPI0031342FCE
MRLTCPNCSARYEVDEAMVPPGGRDVQCSNCSQTWFQPGRRVPEAPVAPAAPEEPVEDTPQEEEAPAVGGEAAEEPVQPERRPVDASVSDILREEAEREARLRRAEAAPEMAPQQEEMSLPEDQLSHRERRIAELENAEDAFETEQISAAVASAAAASRREEFPDIEEINSTLRATGDRREEEASATDVDTIAGPSRRRGSARRGFLLVLVLAAIAAGIYVYAPLIKETVPQVAQVLDSYVEAVNSARFWLDDMARSLAGDAGA